MNKPRNKPETPVRSIPSLAAQVSAHLVVPEPTVAGFVRQLRYAGHIGVGGRGFGSWAATFADAAALILALSATGKIGLSGPVIDAMKEFDSPDAGGDPVAYLAAELERLASGESDLSWIEVCGFVSAVNFGHDRRAVCFGAGDTPAVAKLYQIAKRPVPGTLIGLKQFTITERDVLEGVARWIAGGGENV